MNDVVAPKKPAARKAPAKQKEAAASQEQAPQQQAAPAAPKAFPKKEIGGYNFPLKDVPQEFKEAAQVRFGKAGVAMQMASSKANGTYKGEILNSESYLAQQVSANSVVFHKKSDVELVSSDLKWRDANQTLNRANVALHYDESKAKAYPHDPERENLNKMVNAMKKSAEQLKIPDLESFKKSLDLVGADMWDKLKDRRKVAEQTKERPQPQREQQQERSR